MVDDAQEPEKDMRRRQLPGREAVELPASIGASGRGAAIDPQQLEVERVPAMHPLPEPPPGATPQMEVDHWRDVVLRDPANAAARRRLARVHEARGEAMLAVEQLEAARAATPWDIDLIVELGQALTAQRRFDVAERELRRALKLQPDSAAVHLGLGVISFRRGLYAQADAELKRAVELDPESGNAYFYRGEALNQLSRIDEALEMLARAVQLQPMNSRAYYVMGILYDKKSRPQEAAAMFRKARDVGSA
jgi:tetratricopeptide (TPR) repeat protein